MKAASAITPANYAEHKLLRDFRMMDADEQQFVSDMAHVTVADRSKAAPRASNVSNVFSLRQGSQS